MRRPDPAAERQSRREKAHAKSTGNGTNTAALVRVAQACGVSIRTVSRVLKGAYKGTWPSMAKRAEEIRRAASKLGYRPNTAARAMRSGRFDCVGLLLGRNRFRSDLPPALLAGLHDELADHHIHMIFSRLPDPELASERRVPRLLEELAVDGLLIDYTYDIPPGFVRLVREHGLPVIWVNSKRGGDCVHPDDLGAGRIATKHLLALGHKRIAYVSSMGGVGHYSERDRRLGCEQAMRHAGKAPMTEVAPGAFRHSPDSLQAYLSLLRQRHRPTGVVSYGPLDAGLAMRAADLLGLRVPQDLSIVSIDSLQFEPLGMPYTTVMIPEGRMGQEAARMILCKVSAPDVTLPATCLPVELVMGATSAPPGGA
jgi:LacI family transcriptional regulator